MRRLLLIAALLVLPITARADNYAPSGGTPGTTSGTFAAGNDTRIGGVFTPEQYGADPTGATDATSAIQSALTAAAVAHGTVMMCGRYLQNSANITQPAAVAVTGCQASFPGASWANRDYSTTLSTVVQNSAYTWNVGNDARLSRLTFQLSGLSKPTSFAQLVALPLSFAGTAITLTGSDNALDDLLILGYATCVNTYGQSRFNFHRVNGDCTQGVNVGNLFDWAIIDTSEFYPFLTYNTAWANSSWPVTAETTSGGLVVLTLGTPTVSGTSMAVGMLVNVAGITGQPSLTNRWTVSAVSGNQVTLAGTSLAPTTTGTLSTTSAVVPVASTANIGVGQTVTGTGIPASTTVTAVNTLANLITLSATPTAAGSGVSLSFGTPAYTSGGSVYFNELRRTGEALITTNAQGLTVTSMRSLGHDVAYHAGSGSQGNIINGLQVDNEAQAADPNTIAYLADGVGPFSSFNGGFFNSQSYGAVINGNSGSYVQPTVFSGTTFAATNNGYGIWTNFGRTSVTGSPSSAAGPQIYVGSTAGELQLCGNDWQGLPTIQYQASNAAQAVTGCEAGASGMMRLDAGTGAGPRLRLTGSADLNMYFLLNGPNGVEWFGSAAYGYPLGVQLPGSGTIVNSLVANGATSGTSPATLYSNNGPIQIKGAGTNLTEIGSATSLAQIQGASGLSATGAPTSTPATGGTVTLGANNTLTLLQGSSTLASLTVDYPASPTDRQLECVVTQPAITALTIASLGSATFDTSPSSLPAHGELCYRYWSGVGSGTWVLEVVQSAHTKTTYYGTAGSNTYTPVAGLISADIRGCGAGGGGGGGALVAASVAVSGGASGAGATCASKTIAAADMPASVTVAIGAGGTAGAAAASASTAGGNATSGGNTTFGTLWTLGGGGGGAGGQSAAASAGGGAGSVGYQGNSATGSSAVANRSYCGSLTPASSGSGAGTVAPSVPTCGAPGSGSSSVGLSYAGSTAVEGAPAGGTGAGLTAGDGANNGAAGGATPTGVAGGVGGTSGSINGGVGAASGTPNSGYPGSAGGGGYGGTTGGGAGGAGGGCGAGGGGGGSTENGQTAGVGGAGAPGCLLIVEHY